jgi:hypothetical protein
MGPGSSQVVKSKIFFHFSGKSHMNDDIHFLIEEGFYNSLLEI